MGGSVDEEGERRPVDRRFPRTDDYDDFAGAAIFFFIFFVVLAFFIFDFFTVFFFIVSDLAAGWSAA